MLARFLVSFALIVFLAQAASACDKLVFEEYSGVRYERYAFQLFKNITLDQCRRICRLYAECQLFNMVWSEDGRTTGNCEVFNVKDQLLKDIAPDSKSSFFCKHSYRYFDKSSVIICFLVGIYLLTHFPLNIPGTPFFIVSASTTKTTTPKLSELGG